MEARRIVDPRVVLFHVWRVAYENAVSSSSETEVTLMLGTEGSYKISNYECNNRHTKCEKSRLPTMI